MDPDVFVPLMVAFLVSLLFGLRLSVRNLNKRCDETQAEIRRLVKLFEPGRNQ
jgi:hypothetical protein